MTNKSLKIIVGLLFAVLIASCVSVSDGQLSPNASQSVVNIRRADSSTEKKKEMEVYINGRKEAKTVSNGTQGQFLTMNGIHNIQVRLGKHQSQLLTFDCSSEVVEFFVNFEGSGRNSQLNLIKTAGGVGRANAPAGNNAPMPSIIINVDNSASATNTVSGDDNSIR